MTYQDAIEHIQSIELPYEVEIGCLEVLEEYKGEFDSEQCSACVGSGEGMYSGSTCKFCKGKGEIEKKDQRYYDLGVT